MCTSSQQILQGQAFSIKYDLSSVDSQCVAV